MQLEQRQGDLDRVNEALNTRDAHVHKLQEQVQQMAAELAGLQQENRLKVSLLPADC